MALSEIWTMEPQGDPGSAVPLASLGVESLSLTRQSQAPATVTLSIPGALALTADWSVYAWESQWVIRRDGAVWYRGRVDQVPRVGMANSESVTITLRCVIWDLMRTPYVQEWDALQTTGAVAGVSFGRVRLGLSATGVRQTTKDAIAQVIAAAEVAGTSVVCSADSLPDLVVPTIEGRGKMCGELLRDLLRWHPGATMQTVSSEEGDTIVISHRDTAEAVALTIGERPLAGIPSLVKREDLAVDSVHVSYETSATQYAEITLEEDETPIVQSTPGLVVGSDIYPAESPLTRRSMRVDVMIPTNGDSSTAAAPNSPPQSHTVPVKTRPLPADGATNTEAKAFYLEHVGLKEFGLTAADLLLPAATVGDVVEHSVSFAHADDDPDDPMFEMPATINPASTPLWRPTTVSDFPRYLVSGQLGDWMNVKAAEVLCEATVGVLKTAVDAMSARKRRIFMGRYRPEARTYTSADVWLIQATVRVVATTAQTRSYPGQPSKQSASSPTTATGGSATQALADAIIPDLARRLYEDRATAPWEGSIELAHEEPGGTSYLGKVLSLVSPDRPEWATMRALIQSESIDVTGGRTTLQIGPPNHLEQGDWIALHRAARRLDEERSRMAGSSPPANSAPSATPSQDGDGGVFVPSFTPKFELRTSPSREPRLWDLKIVDADAGTVEIIRPGTIIKDFANLSVALPVTDADNTWTVTAGHKIWITLTGPADTPVATMESGSTWTDSPAPVETTGSAGTAAFAATRYVLWEFVSEAEDGGSDIQIKAGLFARPIGENTHFLRGGTTYHQAGNRPFWVHFLMPYHRVIS